MEFILFSTKVLIIFYSFLTAASANMVQTLPQLDYFEESQRLTTIAPSVEIHKFTIPGEGQFVMMANYFQNTNDDRSTKR